MALIAGLASAGFIAHFLRGFGIFFFAFGCVMAFIGCLWFICRALRSLWRLGLFGWRVARWWFEVSSITWIMFLFSFISGLSLGLLAPGVAGGTVGEWLFVSFRPLFFAFFGTATLGYVLSFVTRRPRRGKAYECVRYFYCTVGVTLVFIWGVPPIRIPGWVALCSLGVGGLALLLAGIVALRQRRWTLRR